MLAPHLGQLLWKLTRTVVDCILPVRSDIGVLVMLGLSVSSGCGVLELVIAAMEGQVGLM
jgi:hypothetical protein